MRHSYYSPLKIFHHRKRIDQIRSGVRPDLLHVHFVPSNRCNQNCNFCAYRSHGYSSSENFNPKDEMPLSKALETLDGCKRLGVQAIEFTGGGEPTMHEGFAEICNRAHELGLSYGVVTNGVRMTPDNFDAITRAKWVRFSIDAGTSTTYAAIRHSKPDTFEAVRDSLRRLVVKRAEKTSGQIIGVGFVITQDNWREVLQATEHAKHDEADNIRISAVFQSQGGDYFRKFHAAAVDLCRRSKELSDEQFTVFNLFGERISELHQGPPENPTCNFQHIVTYVAADSNVYRCCVISYNRSGFLASIADRPFDEVWQSEEVGSKLKQFDARSCCHCMFTSKNHTIDYAVSQNPPHVEFI